MSGNRAIRITEVELTTDSLNSSDCFLLDLGDQLYQVSNASSQGGLLGRGRAIPAVNRKLHGWGCVFLP